MTSRRERSEREEPLDLTSLGAPAGEARPCPYIEGRDARERALWVNHFPAEFYHMLLDFGWRRSGRLIYRPACEMCRQCIPIRLDCSRIEPSRTQRKLLRRNADIQINVCDARPDEEKFDLFVRYQQARHAGDMCTDWASFSAFLYESPLPTVEVEYRLEGRLAGVAIVDRESQATSSVYTYFDPDLDRRSLGTWSVLRLAQQTAEWGARYYYLGYYIRDCQKMNYKTQFRPFELGDGRGRWESFDSEEAARAFVSELIDE